MSKKKKLKTTTKFVQDALIDNLSDLVEEKKKQKKGLTQEKQALEMGIAKSQLTKYLSGAALPKADKLYAMAKYYNCSADFLLGISKYRTADINEAKMCEELGLSEKAIKTLKKWQKTSIKECPVFLINYLFELDYFKYLLFSIHRYIYGDIKTFSVIDKNNKEFTCKNIQILENKENNEDATIIMKSENYENTLNAEYINKIHELYLFERLQKIKSCILENIEEYPNIIKNYSMQGLK